MTSTRQQALTHNASFASSSTGEPKSRRSSTNRSNPMSNIFMLKKDHRARKCSGIADLLLQQGTGMFDAEPDSRRLSLMIMNPGDYLVRSPQLPEDASMAIERMEERQPHSQLLSDVLPHPSIMDLAYCDLIKIQDSFADHTSVWHHAELLDRFKRLVIRAIKEEEDQVNAENTNEEAGECGEGGHDMAHRRVGAVDGRRRSNAGGAGRGDPVYETALATGFLNGPDAVPVGVPSRFLQKARAQLIWEYEKRVRARMEQLQCVKYQNLRLSQQQEESTRIARHGRIHQTPDGYLSHSLPPVHSQDSLSSMKSTRSKKVHVRRGGDTMPMPRYLQLSPAENKAAAAMESCTSPPEYARPWNIDLFDCLPLTLTAERRIKDAQEYTASLDKKEEHGADSPEPTQRDGEGNNPPPGQPEQEQTATKLPKNASDPRNEIPMPTFVYVMSRLLFRLHYANSFPTGLFNRELIDPYYFPEQEELSTGYFFRYFPRLAADAQRMYDEYNGRLNNHFTGADTPIEPEDYFSVHALLCPPKRKDNAFNDISIPWLYLTDAAEDNLLGQSESQRQDRRRYREMLQSLAQKSSVCEEVRRMMTICRLVAFEFFETIDTTQRGAISWAEFTDALIEHAEVAHHREKAEEAMKVMQTCASVFDHYQVDLLPPELLHLGYSGTAVAVGYSGSLVILKGPFDFAVCNGASGGSVEFKFTVRCTKDIVEDLSKALVLAERQAANGDTTGIQFHDAETTSRPWRNNTKVPGVFIRYIDGKRLNEVAAVGLAGQMKTGEDGEAKEKRSASDASNADDGPGGGNSSDGGGSKSGDKRKSKTPKPNSKPAKSRDTASVRNKDDINIVASLRLCDMLLGLPPILLVLCDDLMLRVYVMVPMLVALPETAILSTYETITCMDWCGASGGLHEGLKRYLLCGSRNGDIRIVDIHAALKKMPRLREARHGVIGSVFSSNAGYADLAGITHQDDLNSYVIYQQGVHHSVVTAVDVSDSGVFVSSSLDGEVFMGRLSYAVDTVQFSQMRRFHVCDSGVRTAVYANLSQVIVVQTVASKVFVYGVANQKVHVELYDPQAPHFFPIIAVIVVDSLDQLITADTSGFVKVWSLRRCTPLSAFYALSKFCGIHNNTAAANDNSSGEAARLFDVDQQGGDYSHDGGSGEGKKGGVLSTCRRTIEKTMDIGLALAPLRSLAYDFVTHRIFATGLQNSVMCTFVFGQGGSRAHMERISFIGISFRHQWLLTMSCSDCRIWALSSATMALGIRANNAEYNLLASERMSHLDKSGGGAAGMLGTTELLSNLHDFLEDTSLTLEAVKRLPPSSEDVIRGVEMVKLQNTDIKRVPLHIPKSEVAQVRQELQRSKYADLFSVNGAGSSVTGDGSSTGKNGGGGGGAASPVDTSNETDNTRNTNVKHGDILCAVIGQHDRLIIYALSTGDIRVHRSDSGRLVKTYVTFPPSTEQTLSAALYYRHLYISASSHAKQDDFGVVVPTLGGDGSRSQTSHAVMGSHSLLRNMSNQQRVEAVAGVLQRMLSDTKDAVMMGGGGRTSFHVEPVNLICLDSTQELVVMYADGVIRYFPLIGQMLTAHKLIIPEFLVSKVVGAFNSPLPTRRPMPGFVNQPNSPNSPYRRKSNARNTPLIEVRVLEEERSFSLDSRRNNQSQRLRRASRQVRPPSMAKESLEAANNTRVEADAVSLVAVSTYLQLVCLVQVTGVVSVIDVSGGSTSSVPSMKEIGSAPQGANLVHCFVTKEEITAITFMGAYPCLLAVDRFCELSFYLLKGSSTLALVEDFFKALVIDRHAQAARNMRDSFAESVRDNPMKGPIKLSDTSVHTSTRRHSVLPRVWSIRMPTETGTPISIHFDVRYCTVYVGTKEGYISSFGVERFILAADLSPLCISAAEVTLDTYLLALKQQQQDSNEEVIRNFLLIMFGLRHEDIMDYLNHVYEENMKEYARVREQCKSNPHGPVNISAAPPADVPKWENSLHWVFENCESLLRGTEPYLLEHSGPDRLPPLIDIDDINLSDLLLATTIMHDAIRLISIRHEATSKGLLAAAAAGASSPVAMSSRSNNTSMAGSLPGRSQAFNGLDNNDPALVFLRMRENSVADTEEEETTCGQPMVLRRSEVLLIRRWIKQALQTKHQPPLEDPTKPWNAGYRTTRRRSSCGSALDTSSGFPRAVSFKAERLAGLTFPTAQGGAGGRQDGSPDPDQEDHLIASRWVEALFQRHAMFMSDNCPLTFLSPTAALERARREKLEREKSMIVSQQSSGAQAVNDSESNPQKLRKGNWDEFVEGVIPRVQPTSTKQGVMVEMERLLASDMGVIRIYTRRNGYVFIGLEDGTVSLWTPYACARVTQICSSMTLSSSIYYLGESVKKEFTQLYEMITLQRQRLAFETDRSLGRNPTEGESKIKAKIKSMLVNHQLQKMKKKTAKEDADRMEESCSSEPNNANANPNSNAVVKGAAVSQQPEPMTHPATQLMEQHLEDVKDIMQLYCGFQNREDFYSRNLSLEDLFFLPMKMADLLEIESLEPFWYHNAVDLAIDRITFDLCGAEPQGGHVLSAVQRRSMYTGVGGMSVASLTARGDYRLIMAMLNHVLELPTTFEVDYINFAHDFLTSMIPKAELSELLELVIVRKKLQEHFTEVHQQLLPSLAHRLRGDGADSPGVAPSCLSTLMENAAGTHFNTSFSFTDLPADAFSTVSIADVVRMKALRLRVGAIIQMGDTSQQQPSTRPRGSASPSSHPSFRRTAIRRSLVVVDATSPDAGAGEGALHKMAVERCIQTAANAGQNDLASRVALEKKIASLASRGANSESYERSFAKSASSRPDSVANTEPSSESDEERASEQAKINPARAEAWLLSSTYTHSQPLLVMSREESNGLLKREGSSAEVLPEGLDISISLNEPSTFLHLSSSSPSPPTSPSIVLKSPHMSPFAREDSHFTNQLPPATSTATSGTTTPALTSAGRMESETVAFVPSVFLTETRSDQFRSAVPALLPTPAFSQRQSATKYESFSTAQSRLPCIQWKLSEKKKVVQLSSTGHQAPRPASTLYIPPTSNAFVPAHTSADDEYHPPGSSRGGAAAHSLGGGVLRSHTTPTSGKTSARLGGGSNTATNAGQRQKPPDVPSLELEDASSPPPPPRLLSRGAHTCTSGHHSTGYHNNNSNLIARKKLVAEILPGPQHK